MRELQRKHPGVRFRIVWTVHAICPKCGTHYTYLESERTFVVETTVDHHQAGDTQPAAKKAHEINP